VSSFTLLYDYLRDQIKEDMTGEICGIYGNRKNAFRVFGEKDEGRRPLARPRHKMGGYRVWIGLVWLRARSRRGCYENNNKRFRGFHKVQAIS
jgi:hypothetical protein